MNRKIVVIDVRGREIGHVRLGRAAASDATAALSQEERRKKVRPLHPTPADTDVSSLGVWGVKTGFKPLRQHG
jgi:hypothetical protein